MRLRRQTRGATDQAEMPFLDHLDELRSRLIRALLALIVGMVIGLVAVTQWDVLGIVQRPIAELLPGEALNYSSVTTPFITILKLGFIVGLIVAFPYLALQAWGFLSPALYESERKFAIPAIASGTILFIAGISMAYFLVLPLGLNILLNFFTFDELNPVIMINEYLTFAVRLILAFGLIFELPVVLVFLSLVGIVTPEGLAKYRRHAIVVMAVVSAFLTPADPYTMLAMMLPMMFLYEISVIMTRVLRRRRQETERAAEEGSSA
ncbi:MAG: twin-arginine translocase subunit TatC [Gemmatimonadota bacterium]|uniref:twin-arginine translocase subunit TatC n=1 Tax=Candidatus Palauibacter scopulicola TaxID=3056741 RepID=UPI0023852F65|nr:twin-arginine translocase subunit TatC [Candidatus Palauibacter scopulicola]MDE2662307.1 twin-arginine translocase subunit TatC [Candidatus Palauibacter scopulicola]